MDPLTITAGGVSRHGKINNQGFLPVLIVYKEPYLFLLRVNYVTEIVAPTLACWILFMRSSKWPDCRYSLWFNGILATSSGKSISTLWTRNYNLSDRRITGTWYKRSPSWPLGKVVSRFTPASSSLFLDQCDFSHQAHHSIYKPLI